MPANEVDSDVTKQLDRVLGFFARVESKASFIFALDTGMLALAALNLSSTDLGYWYVDVLAALTLASIVGSLLFLYRCSFPQLKGGTNSLIYFREIAKLTEADFIEKFRSRSEDSHTRDMLGQVWRNAEILKIKFDCLKVAFILTAVALIPWVGLLVSVSILHSHLPLIK